MIVEHNENQSQTMALWPKLARSEVGDIRIFEDKAPGKNTDRPALKEMLAYIREGDEVVVFSIDRLARNLRDLEDIIIEVNR